MELVSAISDYYQQLAEDEEDMKRSGLIEPPPSNRPHIDYEDLLSLIGKDHALTMITSIISSIIISSRSSLREV